MKDNKRVKVSLNAIQRTYDKNPEIQEMIDASMIEVYTEHGASPEKEIFIFVFSLLLTLT